MGVHQTLTGGQVDRWSRAASYAVAGLLLWGSARDVPAQTPPGTETGGAASPSASEDQGLAPKGSFFSSLKQGFAQDLEREVVRGHFDVSSPSGTQRYYCLIDPKTGKREPNSVSGQLVPRRDGMTGIKGAAVTFYRCADAEQKGMLVTSGYLVSASGGGRSSVAASTPAPAKVTAPAVPVSAPPPVSVSTPAAPASAPPPVGVTAPAVPVSAPAPAHAEILDVYSRFVAGQNAHDRAAVAQVLLHSQEFLLAKSSGDSVWGYDQAMDLFERAWAGTWKLDPQLPDLRVAELSPGVAVLVAPLLLTAGAAGDAPPAVPIRWSGVFVRTESGWRIASIFMTPYEGWHAPNGG